MPSSRSLPSPAARPGLLNLVVVPGGPRACVLMAGELDLDGRAHLLSAVGQALRDPAVRTVGLDVGLLTLCDIFGATALLHAARLAEQAGVTLRLTGVRPSLRRLLTMAGATALLARSAPPDTNGC